MERFYNEATAVVSLTDRHQAIETFGLTTLEAMSCGLPVIVPTVGGIAELVSDAENGYKIDVQDFGEIKRRLCEMMGDGEQYASLSRNALIASRRHTAERMLETISSLIH